MVVDTSGAAAGVRLDGEAWDSLGVRGGIVRAERSRSRGRGEHLPKCQIRAKIKKRAIPAKAGSAKSVQKA